MKTLTKKSEYPTRRAIMELLRDEDAAIEPAERLPEGEAFVDLEHLYRGVLRAEPRMYSTVKQAVPRSAVPEEKWVQICERLAQLGSVPTSRRSARMIR